MRISIQTTLRAAFAALAIATAVTAQESLRPVNTFTAKIENDTVGGTDSRYTSGFEFTWAHSEITPLGGDSPRPQSLAKFGTFLLSDQSNIITIGSTFSIGQKVFTPEQVHETEIIDNDRPYAGWLYMNFGYHERTPLETRSISISVGTVGPNSFAEDFQQGFHQLISDHVPEGWDNQIENKLGVNLISRVEKRLIRKNLPNDRTLEIQKLREITLGTVNTSYRTGLNARFGRQLPGSTFSPRIHNSGQSVMSSSYFHYVDNHFEPRKRFYWTGGANISYVAKNFFIEGRGINGSPNIEKTEFVGELELGFVRETKHLRYSFNYVYRTKEFEEQHGGQAFGSFAITFR